MLGLWIEYKGAIKMLGVIVMMGEYDIKIS